MGDLAETIRANAQQLEKLHKRIHSTLKDRSRSPADRETWSRACSEFHARFPVLAWPGGLSRWEAFLARDSSEIESAITFLTVDPYYFRSGYLKQQVWSRLKQAPLSSTQAQRVEAAALAYLSKQIGREFWAMVRYVRYRGSNGFWDNIADLARTPTSATGIKANWLLLTRENFPVRTWVYRECVSARYDADYVPNFCFSRDRGV